jgi:hypothetical protein
MKKWVVVGMGIAGILIITGFLFFYLQTQEDVLGVVSPLADDYQKQELQQQVVFDRSTTNQYPPNEYFPQALVPKFNEIPDIKSDAFAVMERKSGELLFAKT